MSGYSGVRKLSVLNEVFFLHVGVKSGMMVEWRYKR